MKKNAMTIKREHDFEYAGAGFPVIISEVALEAFGDEWIVKVDFFALENLLAKELCVKTARLSGNEVRFLRQWLGFSMAELAEHFGYSAPAVHKWQQRKGRPAGMHWAAEAQLRLLVLDKLGTTPAAFRRAYRNLLKPLPEGGEVPIRIAGSKVTNKCSVDKPDKKTTSVAKPSSQSRHAA